MLDGNGARLIIWSQLQDKFSYTEFVAKCEEQNIVPMSASDFAMKVGRLVVAEKMYPELTLVEAYIRIMEDHELSSPNPIKATPLEVTTQELVPIAMPDGSLYTPKTIDEELPYPIKNRVKPTGQPDPDDIIIPIVLANGALFIPGIDGELPNDYLESKGLGDTIAKITKATGLDKLAEIYERVTGRPCGCSQRQEALNKLVPYGIREKEE